MLVLTVPTPFPQSDAFIRTILHVYARKCKTSKTLAMDNPKAFVSYASKDREIAKGNRRGPIAKGRRCLLRSLGNTSGTPVNLDVRSQDLPALHRQIHWVGLSGTLIAEPRDDAAAAGLSGVSSAS